jgi:hypothetical protein
MPPGFLAKFLASGEGQIADLRCGDRKCPRCAISSPRRAGYYPPGFSSGRTKTID